ncbi:putative Proteasome activator complex subunit 1 protein [Naja naja]|nr:putative Proteasome activator complex subunit 1 protein [Naja naja]
MPACRFACPPLPPPHLRPRLPGPGSPARFLFLSCPLPFRFRFAPHPLHGFYAFANTFLLSKLGSALRTCTKNPLLSFLLLPMATLEISPVCEAQVNSFKENLCVQAEELVARRFPEKVVELSNFLKAPELNVADLVSLRAELDIPMPDPKKDEERRKQREICLWLQLLVPRIEDGNNFGVAVQGDYRQLVHEIDEAEYAEIRFMINELRNIYAVIYDSVLKNFDKIKKPRDENKGMIY